MNKMQALLATIALLFGINGGSFADFNDGLVAYEKRDYKAAFDEFKPLAEQGDAGAQAKLGKMYLIGLGVDKDEAKGIEWYLKAAEHDSDAQFWLGRVYDGWFYNDNKKAMKWYRKAAEQNHAKAQFHLGKKYKESPLKNIKKSIVWFKKASDNGFNDANLALSIIYLDEQTESSVEIINKTKGIALLEKYIKDGELLFGGLEFVILSKAYYPGNITKASHYARTFFNHKSYGKEDVDTLTKNSKTDPFEMFLLKEYNLFIKDSKKPSLILTCSLYLDDNKLRDKNLLVDFKNKTVDGWKAKITDSEISFTQTEGLNVLINRLTGSYLAYIYNNPTHISGDCMQYTDKKF